MPIESKLIFGLYLGESGDWEWQIHSDEYNTIDLARLLNISFSQILEGVQLSESEDFNDDIHIEGTQQKEGGVAS
jgi:hypothetical protein